MQKFIISKDGFTWHYHPLVCAPPFNLSIVHSLPEENIVEGFSSKGSHLRGVPEGVK